MNEHDRVRLRHMLDAAREAVQFSRGQGRKSLDSDRMLVRALSMSVGIIGEAASRVSREFQETTPQIPWTQITGMRNHLIHAYFNVNLNILWETVTDEIPSLIVELEQILSAEE